MNTDIYDYVIKGNIEKSLYETSKLLIENKNIDMLEETFIQIISYIGSFISVRDIIKLNDITKSAKELIEKDEVVVIDFLILITKMCIICDIYNKHQVIKTGIMQIKVLREKILDVFNEDIKLSSNGIYKFSSIIPPTDSDSYLLSLKIIGCFIRFIKYIETIPTDDCNNLQIMANKFRNCFDYIIRKKYIFETSLFPNDHEAIWFLWGFVSILYQEEFIANYYWLFNYELKKTKQKNRIGLIWAVAINIIYSHKKDTSINWNKNELNVINKIEEIGLDLYKEVKSLFKQQSKTIIKNDEQSKEKSYDGLEYVINYIPKINNNNSVNSIYNNEKFEETLKTIITK